MEPHISLYAVDPSDDSCYGALSFSSTIVIIIISCLLGIAWAIFNFLQVRKINV